MVYALAAGAAASMRTSIAGRVMPDSAKNRARTAGSHSDRRRDGPRAGSNSSPSAGERAMPIGTRSGVPAGAESPPARSSAAWVLISL